MKKNYIYFVSYYWQDNGTIGYGNIEINSSKKFDCWDSMRETSKTITNKCNGSENFKLVILNFILLRTERKRGA